MRQIRRGSNGLFSAPDSTQHLPAPANRRVAESTCAIRRLQGNPGGDRRAQLLSFDCMPAPDRSFPLAAECRLLRYREVAQLCAVSLMTVRRWAAAGRLPKVVIGGTVRFRADDVEALISKGMVPMEDGSSPTRTSLMATASDEEGTGDTG